MLLELEPHSIEGRKTKTITTTNHRESITTQSKYMLKHGKMQVSQVYYWFSFASDLLNRW